MQEIKMKIEVNI